MFVLSPCLSNYSRQGQLERSNSLTLEQKEIEAKERILNIFSMRSKIKKWKNNTYESSIFKGLYLCFHSFDVSKSLFRTFIQELLSYRENTE